ncbi:MAG: hypothetical protein H0U65_05305 [Rubrobacter sp.]|nr:hypothetical protein [Rubrobacter sp.]
MGYYTSFALDFSTIPDGGELPEKLRAEIATALEGDPDIVGELEEIGTHAAHGYAKWHSSREDLLRFSKHFPRALFVLSGAGDEPEDLWREYFVDGQLQKAPAEIIYPEFDPARLKRPESPPSTTDT